MKNFTLIALLIFSSTLFAQKHKPLQGEMGIKKEERAKIETLRRAFISTQLDLSQSDSTQFWPIYDKFTLEFRDYKKDVRKKMKSISETENISDREAEKLLKEVNALELKIAALKTSSNKEIAAIIGYAKTAQLSEIERAFKKKLLEELKGRRRN